MPNNHSSKTTTPYLRSLPKLNYMKSYFSFFILAIGISLSLTSCKKDYVCLCTYLDSTGGSESESIIYTNTSKKDANDACDLRSASLLNWGYTNIDCSVK